jgi:hypothetical protein
MDNKRRKLTTIDVDGSHAVDFQVLPYRLIIDILGYVIVSVNMSCQNATFQLVGRFRRDILRSIFLIFRSIRVFSGERKDLPTDRLYYPYVHRPDQFIYIDAYPRFWYKLVSMLKHYDLSRVGLREVAIRGPTNVSQISNRSWTYDANIQIIQTMSNLHVLHLSNVVLTNEVSTKARRIKLYRVHFFATLVAPKCTALHYDNTCSVYGTDIRMVTAPIIDALYVQYHAHVDLKNDVPELIPYEYDPKHVIRYTTSSPPTSELSLHKIVDFARLVFMSIRLPWFQRNEHTNLSEFVSLQCLSLILTRHCCVQLPRHEIQYVRVAKGYADYLFPRTQLCTYCDGDLQDDISHIHGEFKAAHVMRFDDGRRILLDANDYTKRILFSHCWFTDIEDIAYKAKHISAVSCSGRIRVDCDVLRLKDCPSIHWEGSVGSLNLIK